MKVGVFVDGGRRSERAADVKERETEHLWARERKPIESMKVQEGGIVVASMFGDQAGPRMCPWLLLCVSAWPGWHQWHRHFPAASLLSWATAAHPGTNLHTHTHYLSVFPLSRPRNRLCVCLSRPGMSEPYDPDGASQTELVLRNNTLPAKTAHVHSGFPGQQPLC